jgi:hypothetical protein
LRLATPLSVYEKRCQSLYPGADRSDKYATARRPCDVRFESIVEFAAGHRLFTRSSRVMRASAKALHANSSYKSLFSETTVAKSLN